MLMPRNYVIKIKVFDFPIFLNVMYIEIWFIFCHMDAVAIFDRESILILN